MTKVLRINSLFYDSTPFFWAVLTGIGITYVAVSMLAKKQDRAKNQTIKKAE
jgi:hypothetical protein